MSNKKIAIIGGGICGLYLGWKLSEKDHQVTIFERKKEIGNNVCSGLFSQRILDFVPLSAGLIQNKIKATLLHFPRKTIKIEFNKEFYVMDHSELDKLAASLAQKAGAKILFNENINKLPLGFDRIIGCDGADSTVRKELGLPSPRFRLGIQSFLKKEDFSDFVETWPCKDGFIWKIPRGKATEWGIISEVNLAKKIFEGFLGQNIAKGCQSKIIPQGFIIPSNASVTLCGDAAGLTKPWSGGGVIWALTAANILLKNFPDFLAYKKATEGFFSPKIIISKITTKLIYFLGFRMPWLLPKNAKIESDFLL